MPQRPRHAVVEITTRFSVDLDAWADEYAVPPAAACLDLRRYWSAANGAALIPAGPRWCVPDPPTTTVKIAAGGRELRGVSRCQSWED